MTKGKRRGTKSDRRRSGSNDTDGNRSRTSATTFHMTRCFECGYLRPVKPSSHMLNVFFASFSPPLVQHHGLNLVFLDVLDVQPVRKEWREQVTNEIARRRGERRTRRRVRRSSSMYFLVCY